MEWNHEIYAKFGWHQCSSLGPSGLGPCTSKYRLLISSTSASNSSLCWPLLYRETDGRVYLCKNTYQHRDYCSRLADTNMAKVVVTKHKRQPKERSNGRETCVYLQWPLAAKAGTWAASQAPMQHRLLLPAAEPTDRIRSIPPAIGPVT